MGGKGDRDTSQDILPYGVVFNVSIQPLNDDNGNPLPPDENAWQFLKKIYIKGKSEKNKQMSFTISGLDFRRWYFRLKPEINPPPGINSSNTIRLDTNNNPLPVPTPYDSGKGDGSTIRMIAEYNLSGVNDQDIADAIEENYDKRVASSDRGAPVSITSVSEVIYPEEVGGDITYAGVAMAGITIKASDRINSAPDLTLLVNEGREIRNHIAYGVSETDGMTLEDTGINFGAIDNLNPGGSIIRNLETGEESTISSVTATTITSSVTWTGGDRYLVYNLLSSPYFPDIYVDVLINPEGGLGSIIDGDNFIDYASIVEATKFCADNNFFFDGVLEQEEEFSTWATEQASFSRLIPLRVEGRYGLAIEQPDLPVKAVFNESNIIKETFTEEVVPWQDNAVNQVVLTVTNGNDLQRPITAVTARTQRLNLGIEKLNTLNVEALSITDLAQAENIAATFLKSKRLQDRAINFSTALQGVYLSPSDLIIVQHQITEFDFETSGYVKAIAPYNPQTQTQRISLSRDFPAPGSESDYRATIQLQSTGEVLEEVPFTNVIEFGESFIEIQGLSDAITLGDPVLIGKVTTVNRKYRVQSIGRKEDKTISITAINWTDDIFNHEDIVIIKE